MSWKIPMRLLWRDGHYWEAIVLWFVMGWITFEAYCLPKQSMARAMREIQRAKR